MRRVDVAADPVARMHQGMMGGLVLGVSSIWVSVMLAMRGTSMVIDPVGCVENSVLYGVLFVVVLREGGERGHKKNEYGQGLDHSG